MPKPPVIRRYTTLPALLYLLDRRALTLVSPSTWEDRNDAHFLELYRERKQLQCVLALCFTEAAETYHHWRVFADGVSGVCLEFDKASIIESLRKAHGVSVGHVKYKPVSSLRKSRPRLMDLPFVKRYPFRDEHEFRIIWEAAGESPAIRDLPLPESGLKRVVFNPWIPEPMFEAARDLIRRLDGWSSLRIKRTTLVNNAEWQRLASEGK